MSTFGPFSARLKYSFLYTTYQTCTYLDTVHSPGIGGSRFWDG